LHTQALLAQRQKRLAQPPIAGRLADSSRAGGRLETTSVLHRGQEPNPGRRIPLQVHRRTAFEEGVASIDRTWGAPTATTSGVAERLICAKLAAQDHRADRRLAARAGSGSCRRI